MIGSGGTIRLADGSALTAEAEWADPEPLFLPKPVRVTYKHDGTEISLEGVRHLVQTIGLARELRG
jgi:hypothetical protein